MASETASHAYRPRRAWESPLYKLSIDHVETYLEEPNLEGERPARFVETSIRSFLECGIPRFGVVRFGCKNCAKDIFVPFSCKRRIACPSCDAKRAAATSALAMEGFLPFVPYRQWVLVLPKRLRYFVHRSPALASDISQILARTLERYYKRKTGRLKTPAATAQMHVIQRFGSKVNLHIHDHAVISDGVFERIGGRLWFVPAPEPTEEELAALSRSLRRKILLRMLKTGAIPEETGRELLARKFGGFSLNGQVRIEAEDRPALERLLRYFLRPALSLERLSYDADAEVVRYRAKKGAPGSRLELEWKPLEFLARFAKIIPPPRLHLVRYHGALAPNAALRDAVTWAARRRSTLDELQEGVPLEGLAALTDALKREARKALSAACRAWAACLRRVFEIEPLLCPSCGKEMAAMSAILDGKELVRLLKHLDLPSDFDKTRPARAPPEIDFEISTVGFPISESQINPASEKWEGVDEQPAD